MQEIEVTEVPR